MFLNTPYDESTWELITSALQGDLSPEEELQFKQWLESSEENRAFFEQILTLWKNMDDLPVLELVDDEAAWNSFQRSLTERTTQKRSAAAVPFTRNRWLAAAAVIILATGAVWWIFSGRRPASTFETARGEQRTLSLADGSTVTLQPETRIRLAADFNENENGKERTVFLLEGTAQFEVAHSAGKTFTVEMDAVRVQDIGTRFTIAKTPDSVLISVSAGMVAVTPKALGQSRNIGAGEALCLYTGGPRTGDLREESIPLAPTDSLQFFDVPLSEVLAALEKHSGRSVRLTDASMGQKRITIKLGGESLEDALRLICASMHLEYTLQSDGYVLDKRDSARRR